MNRFYFIKVYRHLWTACLLTVSWVPILGQGFDGVRSHHPSTEAIGYTASISELNSKDKAPKSDVSLPKQFAALSKASQRKVTKWNTDLKEHLKHRLSLYPSLATELNHDVKLIFHYQQMVKYPYYLAGLVNYRFTVEGQEDLPRGFSAVMDNMEISDRKVKYLTSVSSLNKAFDQVMIKTIISAWRQGIPGIHQSKLPSNIKTRLTRLYHQGYTQVMAGTRLKYQKSKRPLRLDLLFFKENQNQEVITSDVIAYSCGIVEKLNQSSETSVLKIQIATDNYDQLSAIFTYDGKHELSSHPVHSLNAGKGVVIKSLYQLATNYVDDEVIIREKHLASDQRSLIKFSSNQLCDQLGFSDRINTCAHKYGLSIDQYVALQEKFSLDLSVREHNLLNKVRDEVELLGEKTILSKIISLNDMDKYLKGKFTEVGGWFTTFKDSKHLSTFEDIYYGARLDTRFNDFSLSNDGYAVIRFRASNVHEAEVPRASTWERKKLFEYPYSGYGITSGIEGRLGVPEWKMKDHFDLEDGAELWQVSRNGKEQLRAIYVKRFNKFVMLNAK